MKTYLRILQFARPYADFLPLYLLYTVLGIFFGIANFGMLIPLLNILFDTTGKMLAEAPTAPPDFNLSLSFITGTFNYYFRSVIETQGRLSALSFVCLLLIASVFLSNLFRYLSLRLLAKVRSRVIRNLRATLYHRVMQLELGYFSSTKKGDLMSRFTNDVQEVETSVVNSLTAVIREPLSIISFFAVLFFMSVKLTLFTLILLPLSGGLIAGISKRLRNQAKQSQSTLGTMLSVIDETLGGVRVIKAFNAEPYITGKFHQQNEQYARTQRNIDNTRDLASPFSEFAGVSLVAALLYFGGTLVLGGQSDLTAANFITYIVLFSQVLVPAKALSAAFSNIQRGLVAGERVLSVIDTEPTIIDRADAHSLPPFQQQIEFRDVAFSYGDNTVLQGINLTIPKGKTVALVGPSGGGKSTLADLVPRFYDPTAGQILIDGHDLRACTLHSVRDQMGIVTQESILFNDTIFNNIRFNTEATEAEVIEAAKIANAHEFIVAAPDGYQTMIGDRGARLSGGQRQRLSIARAILRNPPILILDEATSALDTESEKLVQEALTRLMAHRTSLVIAHRLSTVQHADEIVVIQQGRIVERGTHDQLVARPDGLYARLSKLQNNPALA
ncbi:ATP-binding cassette domain-containing protein [Hymenobacter busanensis]|uniref:ATP-binding cassette domain-containing protein n=1 Tax=Hymenobacter busanensis TaxID=2607656 RepID=A0A7L4ZZ25_9BACT|nr:ABC transporter transmembrane domain-containing protein [Hymenobacter busanensis]KAA9331618.1 ATP-binding cassette domain-containing protein [Hymenobacter busanensis]QHJ08769.1 ATP-binding cassette domain-containing protein [Hymenobacter busanensis]